jgi:tetratricopeptide (TPR) repeat protein
MTPGNPLALLDRVRSGEGGTRAAKPIGALGEEYLVFEVRQGGMGEVYFCGTATDKRPVLALKTFQKRLFFDAASRDAFVREAAIWSRLAGIPHIMITLGIAMIEERPFVVMPAIPGDEASLADLLKRRRLQVDEAFGYAWQTCFALAQAQSKMKGLVHGDLKPGNLLLMQGDIFVTDFGLARVIGAGEAPMTLESTWAYRAPECWASPDRQTTASDVYAFGVTLHQIMSGALPFQAKTAEEWRRQHETANPPVRVSDSKMAQALYSLAHACMAKDPASRPRSFLDLCESINQIGKEQDIVQHLVTMMETVRWKDVFSRLQKELRPGIIRSLLELHLNREALEELEALPEEMMTGDLLGLHGTALSLNGRDEEALEWFNRALGAGLNGDERRRCLSEKGLSLKRLHRFDEAIAVYSELLERAEDRFDARIVVNLATVYLTAQRPIQARDLLLNLLRERPDSPEGWGNLGIAYERLKEWDLSVDAYQRALRLNASLASVQVMLAGVLLRLKRLGEADALLYAAYSQGHQSEDWLVKTLATATLLGRPQDVEFLISEARKAFDSEKVENVQKQVFDLIKLCTTGEDAAGEPETSEPEADARAAEPDPTASSHEEGAETISPPFFNVRFYADESMYSIDFYYDVGAADYIDAFRKAYSDFQRDPRYRIGNAILRSQTLYFTQCPGCGIYILTNRDIGKHTRCRLCETTHDTAPLPDPELRALLASIEEATGRKRIENVNLTHVLLLQHEDRKILKSAEEICKKAGFQKLPERTPITSWMLENGSKRGLVKMTQPHSAWRIDSGGRSVSYDQETPPEVERVLRTLRSEFSGVRTMSSTLDLREPSHRAMLGPIEELMDATTPAGGGEEMRATAERLMAKHDFKGARAIAERMLAQNANSVYGLELVARTAMLEQRWAEAARQLERVTEQDPLHRSGLQFLSLCYQRMGQQEKAAAAWARLARLGGPVF